MNEKQIEALLKSQLSTPAEPPATVWRRPQRQMHYSTVTRPAGVGVVSGALGYDDWVEARVETPTRAPSAAGDVLVPLLQALISGVLGAILAAVLLRGRGAGAWLSVGAVVAAAVWLLLLADHRRLLRTVETWTRQDLDRDGAIGQPRAQETLRVEVVEERDSGKTWSLAELPVSREKLTAIARGVQRGTLRLSRRDLASLPGIGSDKARQILAELERAGFLAYPKGRNHPDGAQLTAKGKALMRGLLGW
ncbi:MAG: hypothetical protein J7M16_00360 [Anaerolineae bacterium]|nr:hypothetical protein [Anaerolineae bacterium]